jgi:Carboxypeptidase regulatory-like domain
MMWSLIRHVMRPWVLLIVVGISTINAAQPGFLEGHLKVFPLRDVELADGDASTSATAANYAKYPLIILSQDGKKEIARVTADENGNYRIALPPGEYSLDVQGRGRGHVRAKPQRFTVASNQTVRVDMDIDTGVR